jgi:hypothetical protein
MTEYLIYFNQQWVGGPPRGVVPRARAARLGGFAVVDVADEEAARLWTGRVAVACGWPQEVRRFRAPTQFPETS